MNHPNIYSDYMNLLYNQSDYKLFLKILKSNIAVLIINLFGSLTFGLFTIINLFFNGFVLAYALTVSLRITKASNVFNHTYPHIIEVLAFIISGAIGMDLGKYFFNIIFKKSDDELHYNWIKAGKLLFFCLLILFISAITETKISAK